MSLSVYFLSFRKALTAAAHVVHGEAERLVEEKVLDLSQVSRWVVSYNECKKKNVMNVMNVIYSCNIWGIFASLFS